MKRVLPVFALLFSSAPLLAAEGDAAAPAAAELTRLLDEFLAGASRHDVGVHERFWADDLIYTRSTGVRVGKAEILENARSGPGAQGELPTAWSAEDVRIQQYGDTAVLAFRLVGRTGDGAAVEVAHYLNTGTFVRRDGKWQAVAWQSTRVPEPKEEAPVAPAQGASTLGCDDASFARRRGGHGGLR